MLFFSAFISRFFCRYFCPLGAFFAVLSGISSVLRLQQIKVYLPRAGDCKDRCLGCRSAQKQCKTGAITYNEELNQPDIDTNECFMCNTCAGKCPVITLKNKKKEVKEQERNKNNELF